MEKLKRAKPTDIKVGDVVRSVCGRDRYRVFVVVEYDSANKDAPFVIANGELRRLGGRKHKNACHLSYVASLGGFDKESVQNHPNDSVIAEICSRYDKFTKK